MRPALLLALALGCTADLPARPPAADGGPDARLRSDAVVVDAATDGERVADARPDTPEPDARPLDGAALDGAALDVTVPDVGAEPDGNVSDVAADAPLPDGPPPEMCAPADEVCNGVDDDCDGVPDEDICGPYVAAHCTVWLGWSDNGRHPGGPSGAWGMCPGDSRDTFGDLRCVRTQRDGWFRTLPLKGNVNQDDALGVALRCADDAAPDVAAWVQSRCAVALGQADVVGGAALAELAPLECPAVQLGEGNPRCVQSAGDGLFHPMLLVGDVDANDSLGVAFDCADPEQRVRAGAVARAVNVVLALQDQREEFLGICADGVLDAGPDWDDCAATGYADNDGRRRCAGSLGDGLFHWFDLDHDMAGCDVLSVALKAR